MTRLGEPAMNITYYHASKFGNGAMVAEEFRKIMAARGVTVSVQHIRDANPNDLPKADLYVFSSPGRMGKPKGNARRFLRKVSLEPGTRYAILTTQAAPKPNKKTGKMPTQEEQDRWERVIPIMNELLAARGLTKVTERAVLVTGLKGRWRRAGRTRSRPSPIRSCPHCTSRPADREALGRPPNIRLSSFAFSRWDVNGAKTDPPVSSETAHLRLRKCPSLLVPVVGVVAGR
jgi:hypothetical protein